MEDGGCGEWWIVSVCVKGDGVRWMCVEGG